MLQVPEGPPKARRRQGPGGKSCNIPRQRRPLASETSILPCLTVSNHENPEIRSRCKIFPAVDLQIRDVECPELLAELCLIPELGSLRIS